MSELGKLGSGADVVSKGELMKALKAKIKPNRIVFSGVGKTEEELLHAIKKKVLLIILSLKVKQYWLINCQKNSIVLLILELE